MRHRAAAMGASGREYRTCCLSVSVVHILIACVERLSSGQECPVDVQMDLSPGLDQLDAILDAILDA